MSPSGSKKALVQAAIDIVDLKKAFQIARYAVDAGVDWIEVGHPLILFYGMGVIEQFAARFPGTYILADMMVMAGTRKYAAGVKKYGGSNITVYGGIPEYSLKDAIETCREEGVDVTIDLFSVPDPVAVASHADSLGADYVMVHFGVDQHRFEPDASPLDTLAKVNASVRCKSSYATYSIEEARAAIAAGADVIVQGHPIFGAEGTERGIGEFMSAIRTAR